MSDESELVGQAMKGDPSAFGGLVELHWARLVRLARSVVGEAEAEDAVQDSLIRAWTRLPQLQNAESFGSWITRLVFRVCLRRVRVSRLRFVSLERSREPETRTEPAARIDVVRLLGSLSAMQRAVIHLTAVEGMTDGEIAPLLGISTSTVRVHRLRARRRIEVQLQGRRTA